MDRVELQRDIRSAISITYELLRHEHVLNREWISSALGELESELARIEAKLGGPKIREIFPTSLDRRIALVDKTASDADPVVAAQIEALLQSVRTIKRQLSAVVLRGGSSGPLVGQRAVTEEGHAIVDYGVGFTAIATLAYARAPRAKIAGGVLGVSALAVAALTRYRRGLMKALPFKTHGIADGLLGVSLVAAPFALGYARKDAPAAASHVALGLATLACALVTDYRTAA